MPANHGTHSRYAQGCRCDDCREGHRLAARAYSQRKTAGQVHNITADLQEGSGIISLPSPGPVEVGVQAEIHGVADGRPGLTQIALALARTIDDPKATNQRAAAAKVLVALLDKLHSASARGSRGGLAVVRTMSIMGPQK